MSELIGRSDAELHAEFADYAKLGVSWVRADFYWGWVQKQEDGPFDWSRLDKVVDLAASHGIKMIGLLTGKPAWIERGMTSASDVQDFAQYASSAATHFKGRIDHWEVMNEANMGVTTPEAYTKVLQAAYRAIKTVDATDTVISVGNAAIPSTSGSLIGAVDFLERMYDAGAKGYFDAVGYHPYTYPLLPDDPKVWNGWQIMEDGMRRTMVAHGDGDKQIWMTEIGAPTAGGQNAMTQAEQALVLKQAVQLAAGYDWAGPIMWYSYQDRGNVTAGSTTENWFGLVGPNGERKEAYYAYQAIATKDDDPTPTPIPTPTQPAADLVLKGDDGDNTLRGGAGNDVLQGGVGNDTLVGAAGNDRFVFETGGGSDRIMDFQAGDKIDLSLIDANPALAGMQTFNFIRSNWLSKAGDLAFYQNAGQNATYVQGNTNNDGAFDFSIRVDGLRTFTASDFILPSATAPTPTPTPSTPTGLTLTGTASAETMVGTAGNDVIKGQAGNDTLKGEGGNDLLDGGTGNDTLWGGADRDVLTGRAGRDVLWGGTEADVFRFTDKVGVDKIMDFNAGDRIDLSALDANVGVSGNQPFKFIGSNWLSKAGDLGFYQDKQNGVTHVQVDDNGDGACNFDLVVQGLHTFTASDFIL